MLVVALTSFCVNLDGSTIRLGLSNWGTAQKVEVLSVLESSKQVLLPYSERIQQSSIVVESTKAMPSTLYKRTNTDEIQIKISAKDRYWCQYVFQFAHELGHIMCGFKKVIRPTNGLRRAFVKQHLCMCLKNCPPIGLLPHPIRHGNLMLPNSSNTGLIE